MRELAATLGVTFLLSYSWMFADLSVPNERTRLYLAVSLVDHQDIRIDHAVERFGISTDLAQREGHYYSDKAPGSSLLAAAIYGVARLGSAAEDWTIEELIQLVRRAGMIPLGLLGFLFLRRILRALGAGVWGVELTSFGWMLGSAAFHYSTAFYGHQIVAVCLLAALALLLDWEREQRGGARAHLRIALVGACLGFAVLVEYQATPIAMLFAAYVLLGPMRRRLGLLLTLGLATLPFAGLLLGYNTLAFGGPLELSYSHLVSPELQLRHEGGLGGVGVPQSEYLFGLLLSLHRGLFVTSPLFLLALVGFYGMWCAGHRRLLLLVAGSFLALVAVVGSAPAWFGGWSFSARLLVPVLGLAAVAVAFGVQLLGRSGWLGRGLCLLLVVFSVLYHQAVHLVFAELPKDVLNPMRDVVVPAFERGLLSPNLATSYLGVTGAWSALPCGLALLAVFVWLARAERQTFGGSGLGPALRLTVALLLALGALAFLSWGVEGSWTEARTDAWFNWIEERARIEAAR